MDQLIPKLYKAYGDYINSFRSFPLDLDGLKPVERRVLLSAYLVAREKFAKCPRVDGTCIARFHPHSTTYGTIVQLANQGFLEKQGNFGSNIGIEPSPPAAMRYTECKLNPRTYELMFKYVKHVPWVDSESKDDKEPLYLPTMFPVCLIGHDFSQGIGFGFRTVIPTYFIADLQKRLLWLLGIRKTKPTITPRSNCQITADQAALESLLTTGKASISMKGVIKANAALCKVIVKSWPPGRRFEAILNKPTIKKLLDNQDIGFIDSSGKNVGTEIVFSVLKQRNRDKIYRSCLKAIQAATSSSVTFEITMTDINNQTRVVSVDEMLMNTFKMYTEVNKTMLNHEIGKTQSAIVELNALAAIRDPLALMMQATATFGSYSLEKKVKLISDQSKVAQDVVKEILSKYPIQKLLTLDTDTTKLQEKVTEIQESLTNITNFVLDQYSKAGKELL